MIRFLNLVMVVGALCAAAPSALAQERRPSPGGQQPVPSAAAAPEESPKNRLDRLFDRLKAANLLMTRVGEAIRANEAEISLDLLDTVLALQPNWAEAFARRASVHIQRKDYDAAMRDLRAALALEPRHFMALAGLGSVLGETGNPKRALAAFREALKVHPHMEAIKKAVERLAAEHDGRDI
jgi:tetratricopeptide (TPR) repeat protein